MRRYLRRQSTEKSPLPSGSPSSYYYTSSPSEALTFTITIPTIGPLGLVLKKKGERGAIIKGFKNIHDNQQGFLQQDGQIQSGDILMSLNGHNTDEMIFEDIIQLASDLQNTPSVWPITILLKREMEMEQRPSLEPQRPSLKKAGSFFRTSFEPEVNFNEKLQYFKGFFANRVATGGSAPKNENEMPTMPSGDIVNEMYKAMLLKRRVPEDVMEELIRIESIDRKWKIVAADQINDSGGYDDVSSKGATRMAESLVELKWDAKGVKDLENVHVKLSQATEEWIIAFIDGYGLDYLTMRLPDPSPFTIEHTKFGVEICIAILRVLMVLNHFASGIDSMITMPGLVQRIVLCFHTDNVELKTMTLQLLGIICYNSEHGHSSVLTSFDDYQHMKGERIRFSSLKESLKSTRFSLTFKEDILSFINILVNKTLHLDARVTVRQDFMALGMFEYFEQVRMKSCTLGELSLDNQVDDLEYSSYNESTTTTQLRTQLDNIEKQIDVFETFMEDDRKDVVYSKTDLSDMQSVFEGLIERSKTDTDIHNCMLSILQQLLFIPLDRNVGKEMWSLCQKTVREITLLQDTKSSRAYCLSFSDKKALLQLRDQFSTFLAAVDLPESNGSYYTMDPIELIQNRKQCRDDDSGFETESAHSCTEELFTAARDHPTYTKYFKLLNMGMPQSQLELKMNLEGLNSDQLNRPDEQLRILVDEPEIADEECTGTLNKYFPDFQKFFKLLKLGMPMEQVQMKMSSEGFDPSILENPDGVVFIKEEAEVLIKDDPTYQKYFKLLKLGMPRMQVEMKMSSESLNVSFLNTPDAPLPRNILSDEKIEILVKDSLQYKKFFKLLQMGLSKPQVVMKMKAEGLDAALLDTPDVPVPDNHQASSASLSTVLSTSRTHLDHSTPKKEAPKTRNVYWESLSQETITGTIWNQEYDVFVDVEELKVMFTSAPISISPVKSPIVKAPRHIALVDVKRANNIGIMLARFRLPYTKIRDAILHVDAQVLSMDMLQSIITFAPTEDELDMIRSYTGEICKLGDTEQFFKTIESIPRLKARLVAISAAWQWDNNVLELKRMIAHVQNASEQLLNNSKLPCILHCILQVGNALNHGTSRSSALGFRIEILVRLSQVKASDGSKNTLLHFIASSLRKKSEDLMTFLDEIPDLENANRITTQVLKAGMHALENAVLSMKVECEAITRTRKDHDDQFILEISPIVERAKSECESLRQELSIMQNTFSKLVQVFGGETEEAPDVFFGIFFEFSKMLLAADRENERIRFSEERKKRRTIATEKRLADMKERKVLEPSLGLLKDGNATDIVKAIKTKRHLERSQQRKHISLEVVIDGA